VIILAYLLANNRGLAIAGTVASLALVAGLIIVFANPGPKTPADMTCAGNAACFTGPVTKIVDGDTLDVNDMRIRLALVNTPEKRCRRV
jgi:endonuclease YncB( thermonuclease family)